MHGHAAKVQITSVVHAYKYILAQPDFFAGQAILKFLRGKYIVVLTNSVQNEFSRSSFQHNECEISWEL